MALWKKKAPVLTEDDAYRIWEELLDVSHDNADKAANERLRESARARGLWADAPLPPQDVWMVDICLLYRSEEGMRKMKVWWPHDRGLAT
jgi:hypothetical protein